MAAPSTPPLFELGPKKPTTRAIALQVREHGVASLDQAQRRADEARYQEVSCRSALNPVKGMPFGWTLNPYRGCTHGCHYCFARRYQSQFELGPGDEFSSLIFVKINFAECSPGSWTAVVDTRSRGARHRDGSLSANRRPLQDHAASLEALVAGRTPVGIVTKGPMVVRDADVLKALTRCRLYRLRERPDGRRGRLACARARHRPPLQRLRAVRTLRDAGVNAGVLMAPVVPGFTSHRSKLERTIKAVADHGAAFLGANVLYLKGGTRDHFMGFLAQAYPHMVDSYEHLYAGAYAAKDTSRPCAG